MLYDSDGDVRLMAMLLLCKLRPSDIEAHAAHVVAHLEDADSDVRLTAMRVLSRLEPAALVEHAADVVQKLVVQTLNRDHELEDIVRVGPNGAMPLPTGMAASPITASERSRRPL